ncbi:MAG: hypothetical protein PUA68_03470 [Bacilli bacterium]|nr:hypothetical protein [Bacilli bacterium]
MKYRLKKKNILILCGILVGIVLLNYAYTYAKYVANSTWNYYLQSKEFFFSSDSLDSEGFKNVNTTWDGNKTTFNIKNSISLDKITDYDIKYDVSCEVLQGDGAKCLMNGTGTNTFSGTLSSNQMCINETDDNVDVSDYNKSKCEIDGYTWSKIEATKELYFEIDKNIDDVVVLVTLKTKEPYSKTITGTFTLHKGTKETERLEKSYESFTNYDILTIKNSYQTSKCVDIKFDSTKFRIDTDNLDIKKYEEDNDGYVNKVSLQLERNNDYKIKFYKTIFDELYDDSYFTVEESNNCN